VPAAGLTPPLFVARFSSLRPVPGLTARPLPKVRKIPGTAVKKAGPRVHFRKLLDGVRKRCHYQ
jgi:hypothetical protein